MTKRRRTLLLGLPALLVAALLAGVSWLMHTESGAQWLITKASGAVPGQLDVTGVTGDLGSGLTLDDVWFQNEDISLRSGKVALTVDLDFFPPAVRVGSLTAGSLTIRELGSGAGADPVQWDEMLPGLALPLSVTLNSLRVSGIEYFDAEGQAVFSADSLESAARLKDDLSIERLTLETPGFDVSMNALLGLTAPFGLEASARARFAREDLPGPVAAEINGQLAGLVELELVFTDPQVTVRGGITQLLETPEWDLELAAKHLQWPPGQPGGDLVLRNVILRSSGRIDGYGLAASGTLDAAGFRDLGLDVTGEGDAGHLGLTSLSLAGVKLDLAAEGQVSWSGEPFIALSTRLGHLSPDVWLSDWPGQHPVSGEADMVLRGDGLQLNRLVLQTDGAPMHLEGDGVVDLSDGVVNANLRWKDLSWPVASPAPDLLSPDGGIHLSGTPDDWRVNGEAELAPRGLPGGRLRLAGSGNRDGASMNIVEGNVLGGEISGHARYSWTGAGRWSAALEGRDLHTGVLLTRWPGTINATLGASGQAEPFRLELDIRRLDGTVRDRPVEASGRILAEGNAWQFDDVRIRSGNSLVTLAGSTASAAGMAISADVDDLNTLVPVASGTLIATGALSLLPDREWVRLELDGQRIRWQDLKVMNLSVRAGDAAVPPSIAAMRVEAKDLEVAGQSLANLAMDLSVDRKQQRIRLAADNEHLRLDLELGGSLDDWRQPLESVWRGRLESMRLQEASGAFLMLGDPAGLELSTQGGVIADACFTAGGDAGFCLEGAWSQPRAFSTTLILNRVPVGLAGRFLDTGLEFTQKLNGEVRLLRGTTGKTSGSAHIDISPGEIRFQGETQPIVESGPGIIGFDLQSGSLSGGNFDIDFPGSGEIDVDFSLPDISKGPNAPLSGKATIDLKDLGIITVIDPMIDEASGRIFADLALAGILADPELTGDMSLTDGAVRHYPSGLSIRDIRLSGRILKSDRAELEGSFTAVDGAGELSANADLSDFLNPRFEMSLTGRKLVLVDVPDLKVVAEPDIDLAWQGGVTEINGSLLIPSARIAPSRAPQTTVSQSPDVVIIAGEIPNHAPDDEEEDSLAIRGSVDVTLGEDVKLDLDLAVAKLAGSVNFAWQDEVVPIANGSYTLVGEIHAFGQLLEVTRGNIGFPGTPADNPHLNIRAERQIWGNTEIRRAGVFVTGTLKRPVLEPFTIPATNRDRAQTLLVTGSDFNMEQGVGAVDIGTYIAPRFYVSYGIGVFEDENVLSARYDLGRNWGVKATSGQRETGVDISYTIDR